MSPHESECPASPIAKQGRTASRPKTASLPQAASPQRIQGWHNLHPGSEFRSLQPASRDAIPYPELALTDVEYDTPGERGNTAYSAGPQRYFSSTVTRNQNAAMADCAQHALGSANYRINTLSPDGQTCSNEYKADAMSSALNPNNMMRNGAFGQMVQQFGLPANARAVGFRGLDNTSIHFARVDAGPNGQTTLSHVDATSHADPGQGGTLYVHTNTPGGLETVAQRGVGVASQISAQDFEAYCLKKFGQGDFFYCG